MPADRRHFMVLKAFAAFGHAEIALPGLAAFAFLMALVRRSWRPLLAAASAGAVLGGAIVPLKIGIARPGPVPGPLEGGFGYFPSGHTADTLMCYGTCALILAGGIGRLGGGRTWRLTIAVLAGLQALLVGFSLVWLDYHWVTDVLGSYTLCGAALFGVAWILGMFKPAEPGPDSARLR
jgi:undecaprenyl-diphosphatase